MNARILEAIKKSAAVPSMPQVVLRFLEIMQDPDFDYRDLSRVLSADPGTVSEVLRLANSALFGVRNKVVSVKQALTLLGPKRLRSLLLGRYLVDTMTNKRIGGLDMSYFWRRSLASSVLAAHLAEAICPRSRDEAFIAALLADIGIPILGEALPKAYRKVIDEFGPNGKGISAEFERKMVQVTHGEVSAMVLAHWTLPETICQAVNLHQSPNPVEGLEGTLARILNSSDRMAWLLCETKETPQATQICQEAMTLVGVEPGILLRVLPTVERDIEELADALRIDVVSSESYQQIAQALQESLTVAPTG